MMLLDYGGGLRVSELVRLRIQDVDMERGSVILRGAKGDKDRRTLLPQSLREPLRAHIDRLRPLYTADQAAGVPGVWLPEGLVRKFGSAVGKEWVWQWLIVTAAPKGHPRRSPLRSAAGPALDANRGLSISALRASSPRANYPKIRRPEYAGAITSSIARCSER